jgi:hypothetical protein
MLECIGCFSGVIMASFLDISKGEVGVKPPDVWIGKRLVFERGFGTGRSFCFTTNGSFNVYTKELSKICK